MFCPLIPPGRERKPKRRLFQLPRSQLNSTVILRVRSAPILGSTQETKNARKHGIFMILLAKQVAIILLRVCPSVSPWNETVQCEEKVRSLVMELEIPHTT